MTTYSYLDTSTEIVEDIKRLAPEDAAAQNRMLTESQDAHQWVETGEFAVFEIDAIADDERDRLAVAGFATRYEEQWARAEEARGLVWA